MSGYNIVLVTPEIPNNTGNIGRLCVATNSRLHVVHPLGFEIDDKRVKRAGLDYWPELDLVHHESLASCLAKIPSGDNFFLMSAHGARSLYEISFQQGDWILFGRESAGLPKDLLASHASQSYRIPFPGKVRSFNLSNAVAMVLAEGMRQAGL